MTNSSPRNGGNGMTATRTPSKFDAPPITEPRLHQGQHEYFPPHTVRQTPIALPADARHESVEMLEQILVDTIMLYNMYKKHHWQVLGPTFYQLHLLFDKHAEEQLALVDLLAERIQLLGGVVVAMPHDVADMTRIARPPKGAEPPAVQLSRLLDAHETVIQGVRDGIELTEKNKDYGSNDLLMSDVLRRNELQVWFVSSHLVDIPLTHDAVDRMATTGDPEAAANASDRRK